MQGIVRFRTSAESSGSRGAGSFASAVDAEEVDLPEKLGCLVLPLLGLVYAVLRFRREDPHGGRVCLAWTLAGVCAWTALGVLVGVI